MGPAMSSALHYHHEAMGDSGPEWWGWPPTTPTQPKRSRPSPSPVPCLECFYPPPPEKQTPSTLTILNTASLPPPHPATFSPPKPTPHGLPHLSIPQDSPERELFKTSTPETPASLSSPISGVIDLTRCVKTIHESPITTGGFSDIYKGVWFRVKDGGEQETVKVAIKLLRVLAFKDQECVKARKRLNREVYVWHRLEHPNIVELFGTSYHMSGRPSMVMQWYQNGSASEYLKERSYAEMDRLSLILDVAQGLKYLHTLSPPIVHGDLKGNNVLIKDDGHAALSDFGLSQVIEELVGPTGYTPSNPEVGPIRWQAPEFIDDESCQPGLETDVWSFACTTYELLTNNIPYHYRHRDGMVIKDIQSGIKPPGPDGFLVDRGNKRIQDLLDRCCWSFIPSERLQMADIVSNIEDICANPNL